MTMMPRGNRDWLALLPLLLVPLLLPLGRASELGTLIGLAAGLWLAVRYWPQVSGMRSLHLFALLFACYVGAALISLPGAIDPGRSWSSFAGFWRFLPFGVYVCWVLAPERRVDTVYVLLAALVALWALDAWVQIGTGWSLGGAADARRISGVFGADNLKLGPMLALLSPVLLRVARRRWGWRGVVAGFVLLLGPIIMAGARQAWLEFALVGLAFAWQLGATPLRRLAWLGGAAVLALAVLLAGVHQSPGFAQRIERSAQALQGNEHGLDWALSGRLAIWGTAGRMIAAHPVNGVGVRDFRYAYPEYAHADDPFIAGQSCGPGEGACHPHQWLLEVAASTGLVGLLLWLLGIAVALRAWWRASHAARQRAWPLSLALGVSLFPLNTHLAFYSAWWGLVFWWLLALWCAVLLAGDDKAEARDAPA